MTGRGETRRIGFTAVVQPAHHEACRATKLGLDCTYSDFNGNGIFYACTCSYHGWSCTKGYYVH